MAGKKPLKRKAQRSTRGGTHVNTLNLRGYRVGGQVFSRLTYPDTDPKGFLPRLEGEQFLFDPTLFKRMDLQVGVSDYAMAKVKVTLVDRARKRTLETMTTGADGEFHFATPLQVGRKYEVIASASFKRPRASPVSPEAVCAALCITRQQVTSLKQKARQQRMKRRKGKARSPAFSEMMNVVEVPVKVKHVFRLLEHDKLETFHSGWKEIDNYEVRVPLYWASGGAGRLWLGGKAAMLFDTFVLKVPFLDQYLGNPPGHRLEPKDFWLEHRGKSWCFEGNPDYTCIATCVAMVLRYYGLDVTPRRVMEKACWEYLEEVRSLPNYGMPEKRYESGILQLDESKGKYPYCLVKCLMKAAERIMIEGGVPKGDIFVAVSKEEPLFATQLNTMALLGAGCPVIAIEGHSEEDRERWRRVYRIELPGVKHAVVIRGVTAMKKKLDRKVPGPSEGELWYTWVNDPARPVSYYIGRLSIQTIGQLIVGRRLKQKEIAPGEVRLLQGGRVPPPPRERQPRS